MMHSDEYRESLQVEERNELALHYIGMMEGFLYHFLQVSLEVTPSGKVCSTCRRVVSVPLGWHRLPQPHQDNCMVGQCQRLVIFKYNGYRGDLTI